MQGAEGAGVDGLQSGERAWVRSVGGADVASGRAVRGRQAEVLRATACAKGGSCAWSSVGHREKEASVPSSESWTGLSESWAAATGRASSGGERRVRRAREHVASCVVIGRRTGASRSVCDAPSAPRPSSSLYVAVLSR